MLLFSDIASSKILLCAFSSAKWWWQSSVKLFGHIKMEMFDSLELAIITMQKAAKSKHPEMPSVLTQLIPWALEHFYLKMHIRWNQVRKDDVMGQWQKPCWSQGRQQPLLSPHQPILPCHHKGYEISRARFPLGEIVLRTPDDLFFCRLGNDLQNDLFHDFARDGVKMTGQ